MNSFRNLRICRHIISFRGTHPNLQTCRSFSVCPNKNIRRVIVTEFTFTSNRHPKKRLFSSTVTNSTHKVFFVNAATPEASEISSSNDISQHTTASSSSSIGSISDNSTHIPDIQSSQGIEYIPPPPSPPVQDIPALNELGEPTFASLGFGGWSPVSLLQQGLEFIHVTLDIPWWGTIALATAILRLALFPLIVISQRNAAKFSNALPQHQALQEKINQAQLSGNQYEVHKLYQELAEFMKKSDFNPLKNMIPMFAQAPFFISMFMGLRKCANLPVESFETGGALWFTDLTIADPTYMLPLITCTTLFITLKIGSDGNVNAAVGSNMNLMKIAMGVMPVLMFPFIMNFPTAILCYWTTTNGLSLIQVAFLKIPRVREAFKIPIKIKHDTSKLVPKRGFKEELMKSWEMAKVKQELHNRRNVDEIKFKKAGFGPLVKTYKHNPLEKKRTNLKAKSNG